MAYVRNAWYVSAWTHEIGSERPVGVRVLNESIVIWRNAAGGLAAFEDRCIHRLPPLSLGRCEADRLRCMYHGLLYDRTGRVVEIPGQDHIPRNLRLRVYPVVERHGWVWIWMGDAPADESLIPPIMGLDQPDFLFTHGQLDYVAEARLVNDNLLDLSHIGFLHANSAQLSETWARERPRITEHERGVRSERWIRNEGALGDVDSREQVDTYICSEFFVPGVLFFTPRTFPVGTADALNGQRPDPSVGVEDFATHAVTPVTDKTARYLYINGAQRRGDRPPPEKAPLERIFAEDRTIIEAQQRNIDVTPNSRFMPIAADKGLILFNRLIEKLAREEAAHLSKAAPDLSPDRSDTKNSNSFV
jgi:phenylpropionate dioxygenase-like ring-hydroxylating dioxygenase large terminal subunit